MRTYLISNYTLIDDTKIKSIKLVDTDLVVLFNHARPISSVSSIHNHNNKILFMRTSPDSYWGYKKAIKYKEQYKKIYLINTNHFTQKVQENLSNLELIYEKDIAIKYNELLKNKKKNKSLTSGFIAFMYLKYELYITDICLIGFTGGSSIDGKSAWYGHDYDFEQKFYEHNNICQL